MIIDFAGLADFEISAGAPINWTSRDQFRFFRSVSEAQDWNYEWSTSDDLVVRWGDPRINQILEMWYNELSNTYQHAYSQGYVMHGRRVSVVMESQIGQWHLIPKLLGDEEFQPPVYHHDQPVQMLEWTNNDLSAYLVFTSAQAHRVPIYIEWERYYAMWHMGTFVNRQGEPTEGAAVLLP